MVVQYTCHCLIVLCLFIMGALTGIRDRKFFSILGDVSKRQEVDSAVSIEGATSLEDVLYRRLRCVWFEPQDLGVLAPAVAEHMANILRWDTSEQRRQRVAFEERIAFDLAAVPLAG